MRTLLLGACLLIAMPAMAQIAGFSELDIKRTLGAWKVGTHSEREAFALGIAKQKGAHAPSLYGDVVRRCLDEKAARLPPETHIGSVIDDCSDHVPTPAELRKSHSIALKLSKASNLKIIPFVTDEPRQEEWVARSVAGLEPTAKNRTALFLRMDAAKPGAGTEDVIATLKARPDWVFKGRDDEYWLVWFNGNCHPVIARVGMDGKLRSHQSGLCARPGESYPIADFPEDEAACSLHPEIPHCRAK